MKKEWEFPTLFLCTSQVINDLLGRPWKEIKNQQKLKVPKIKGMSPCLAK